MTTKEKAPERAHSPVGASSMKRWANCPGSVKLIATLAPQGSSEYAKEGTEAHSYAELILRRELEGKRLSAKELEFIRYLPEELREAADVYVRFACELSEKSWAYAIEARVTLLGIDADLFGTADFVAMIDDEIHVVDYKHGAGVFVSPEENDQLLYYALGAFLGMPEEHRIEIERVVLTIVQPRCDSALGPVRSWNTDVERLLDFAIKLEDAVKATRKPDAPLVSGEWCRFCHAAAVCPRLAENAMAVAKQDFQKLESYEPVDIALALSKIPAIETWISAVREFAYKEATAGRVPPGFKLVQKRATRQWVDSDVAASELLLKHGFTQEDISETKLKSPAQIEKMIVGNKAAKTRILEPLVKLVSSGTTLVPDEDSRQEILPVDSAIKDFS